MHDFESLAHVQWDCKYHVVFIPKYRRKVLYGKLRKAVGQVLRDLCVQKGIGLPGQTHNEATEMQGLAESA